MKVLYCLAICLLFTSLVNGTVVRKALRADIGNTHNYEPEFKNKTQRVKMPKDIQTIINEFDIPSKEEVFGKNGKQKLAKFFNQQTKYSDLEISIFEEKIPDDFEYDAVMLYLLSISKGSVEANDGLCEEHPEWNSNWLLNPVDNYSEIKATIEYLIK